MFIFIIFGHYFGAIFENKVFLVFTLIFQTILTAWMHILPLLLHDLCRFDSKIHFGLGKINKKFSLLEKVFFYQKLIWIWNFRWKIISKNSHFKNKITPLPTFSSNVWSLTNCQKKKSWSTDRTNLILAYKVLFFPWADIK